MHGHVGPGQSNTGPRGAQSRHDPFSALRPAHVDPMLGIRIIMESSNRKNARIKINGACREPHVSGFAQPLNHPFME